MTDRQTDIDLCICLQITGFICKKLRCLIGQSVWSVYPLVRNTIKVEIWILRKRTVKYKKIDKINSGVAIQSYFILYRLAAVRKGCQKIAYKYPIFYVKPP